MTITAQLVLPDDPFLMFLQVMSHELCHIFGLKHCYYFDCAMNESGSIAEAATQPLFLCPICLRKMQKAVGFDLLERFKQMLQVIKQLHGAVLETSVDDCSHQKHADAESEALGATEVEVNCFNEGIQGNRTAKDATGEEGCGDSWNNQGLINNEGTDTGMAQEIDQLDRNDALGCGASQVLTDDKSTSSHSEQFDRAVVWLGSVVSSLGQFEDQWVEQEEGHHTRVCC